MLIFVTYNLFILKKHGKWFVNKCVERFILGVGDMFNELLKEDVIVDLQNFLSNKNCADTDLSEYVQFMKEQILTVNGNN